MAALGPLAIVGPQETPKRPPRGGETTSTATDAIAPGGGSVSSGRRAPAATDGAFPLRSRRSQTAGALALLAIAGALAYANSVSNPFVWDDSYTIVDNPHVRHLWPPRIPLSAPPGACTSGRPVAALSLAVNYALGGLDLFGYHLFNIGAHVLAAWVLFGFVRRTLRTPRLAARYATRATGLALVIALVWLVHPLHTAAIDHVSYRTEVLAGLFYLLCVHSFARSAETAHGADAGRGGPAPRPGRPWGALAVAASFLGMASKEIAASAPVMVLLYDRLFYSASFRDALRRRRGFYTALASSWLLLGFLVATGDRGPSASLHLESCTPLDYARTQFGVVAHYLRLAFWPHPLVIDYNWPVAKSVGDVLPAMALVVALWVATLAALRRNSPWSFLGAWFFLILVPSSSLMPLTGALVGEHRMYLPLAAPVVLAVLGVHLVLDRIGGRPPWPSRAPRIVGIALAGAAVLVLGGLTVRRNRDFRSEPVLWADALAKSPGNPRAHVNLGNALVREGKLDAAVVHFEEALRITPSDPQAHYNMGLVLLRAGDLAAATAALRAAVEADSTMAAAHHDLGIALLQQGHYEEALAEFQAAIARDHDYAGALNNLAWLRATCPDDRLRDGIEAVQRAERAVWLTRQVDLEMLDTLAAAYAEAGRFDDAVATAERALEKATRANRADLQAKLASRLDLYRVHRPVRMVTPAAGS